MINPKKKTQALKDSAANKTLQAPKTQKKNKRKQHHRDEPTPENFYS